MLICENCGNQWNWHQTILQQFAFKREKTCPYCGHSQYFRISLLQSWFLVLFPVVIFGLPMLGVADRYAFGIAFFFLIAYYATIPVFGRLCSDKDKAVILEGSKYFDEKDGHNHQ